MFALVNHWDLAGGSGGCCHSKSQLIQTWSWGQGGKPGKLHSNGIDKGEDSPSSLLCKIVTHLVAKMAFRPAHCILAHNW